MCTLRFYFGHFYLYNTKYSWTDILKKYIFISIVCIENLFLGYMQWNTSKDVNQIRLYSFVTLVILTPTAFDAETAKVQIPISNPVIRFEINVNLESVE